MISIKRKFLTYFLIPIAIFGIANLLVGEFALRRNLITQAEEKLYNDVKRFSERVKDYILTKNQVKLTEAAFDEKKDGFNVEYIIIYNEKREILSYTFLGGLPDKILKLSQNLSERDRISTILDYENKKILNVSQPVVIGLYHIGHVDVGYNFGAIEQQYLSSVYIFIALTILVTLSVVIISLRVANSIIKPMKSLSAVVKEFGEGKIEKRAKIETKDEIGILAGVFNKMASHLEHSRRDLIAEKKNVEQRVKELETWKGATVDRELKMVDLKKKIKELEKKVKG